MLLTLMLFMLAVAFFIFLFILLPLFSSFFFFNDTATTEIYTLSLHDALPICTLHTSWAKASRCPGVRQRNLGSGVRSEEHTSELQSQSNLVCRLLLEKKKKKYRKTHIYKNEPIHKSFPTQLVLRSSAYDT